MKNISSGKYKEIETAGINIIILLNIFLSVLFEEKSI
jgi:hypothetical protein